jgi:hypothetical protein
MLTRSQILKRTTQEMLELSEFASKCGRIFFPLAIWNDSRVDCLDLLWKGKTPTKTVGCAPGSISAARLHEFFKLHGFFDLHFVRRTISFFSSNDGSPSFVALLWAFPP